MPYTTLNYAVIDFYEDEQISPLSEIFLKLRGFYQERRLLVSK